MENNLTEAELREIVVKKKKVAKDIDAKIEDGNIVKVGTGIIILVIIWIIWLFSPMIGDLGDSLSDEYYIKGIFYIPFWGGLVVYFLSFLADKFNKSNYQRASKELEDFEKLLEKEIQIRRARELKREEEENNEKLEKTLALIIDEFDKDGNGIIDIIEDDGVFIKLVEKNQDLLLEREKEFNQKFIHPFIKLGDYLAEKRNNLQILFDKKGRIDRSGELENFRGILKDEVHLYELLLINSLNMVASLVDNNQIVFYSLYEKFDKINVFTTNHEKEVSSLLKDSTKLLSSVIGEIRSLNFTMVNAIQDLSYVTEQSQLSMDNKLSEIDSTLRVGNVINSITAYQSYKTNKNTKKLK